MSNQFDRNKILSHLSVINDYSQNNKLSSPIFVEIDLTNKCNHDCPKCTGFRAEGGLESTIETEDAFKILSDIKECGVKSVTFTGGGDPTMHKDFDIIIKKAFDYGLEVGLITNGQSLKLKHFDNLIPACSWIRVSWDAATPNLHDKIHYNGDLNILMISPQKFWQVVNNTKMLSQYKKDKQQNTTIGCAFLVGSHTKHEILDFAKLASESGVDYCQYRPFHYELYDEEIEKLMKEAKSKFSREDFDVLFSEFKFNTMKDNGFERSYNVCHGAHFSTHIAANYNVYVCCHLLFNKNACIGNLKNTSFIDLWRSEEKTRVIDSIDVHKCIPLCRHDSANRLIETIVKSNSIKHHNFL